MKNIGVILLAALSTLTAELHAQPLSPPPGVVIDHVPAATGMYVGSPAIAVLDDRSYVASHDLFGPKSGCTVAATSRIFRSTDRGRSWKQISEVHGAFWSSLFTHHGKLYMLGTIKEYGSAVIRRSADGGQTWTDPKDEQSGLLAAGTYHCAPMPVIEHNGRLWRGMEWKSKVTRDWGGQWFCAGIMSAAIDADLLQARSWTWSTRVPFDPKWPGGAWLEGNAVAMPNGQIADIVRVNLSGGDKAAILRLSGDGKRLTFDAEHDFIDFPGGANKFAIRFDPKTQRYWSLVNKQRDPPAYRNLLALTSSSDLRSWKVEATLLRHADGKHHAWQYVDWLIDRDDIIAASRTAWDGSHGAHDANYLTFHRFDRFRSKAMNTPPGKNDTP